MKEYIKKNCKVLIVLLIIIIIGTIGLTLANEIISANIALGTGEYNVVYTGNATLPTTALEPVYDSAITNSSNASKVMKVEFTVKGAASNPTDIPIIYDVSLTNLNIPTELQSHLLKWKLYKNGTAISNGSFSKNFDSQGNNRMVLTEIQQDLPSYSSTADSYVFYIWISEECTGDISLCTPEMDTQPLMGKTFSGEIRIELSTKAKKQLVRFTGEAGATLVHLGLGSSYIDGTPDFSKISPTIGSYKVVESAVKTYNLDTTRSQYYVTYASTYDFNKTNGTYSLNDASVAQYSSIYQSLVGKYITNYTLSSSSTMESTTNRGIIYKITDASYNSSAKTGVIKYTELSKGISTYSTSDSGIFKSEDDLGTSYYFRGNVTNNYVKFADYYWRIIRINGDGTVRMIFDGTKAHKNGENSTDRTINSSVFNNSDSSNGYVGYMYGSVLGSTYQQEHSNDVNSTIKTYLEGELNSTNTGWYYDNIVAKGFEDYVADAIYCNDRSFVSGTGVGTKATNYGAYQRLVSNKSPILTCSQINDRFTKNEVIGGTSGNGKLKYPIGMITADELVLAGGKNDSLNTNYYLYTGSNHWTITPYRYTSGASNLFNVYNDTSISYSVSNTNMGIRPVISLKADAINSGTGIMTDPFEVGLTDSPALTTLTSLGLTQYVKNNTPDFFKTNYQGTKSKVEITITDLCINDRGYDDLESCMSDIYGMTFDDYFDKYISTEDDKGIYAMEDDQGTSYYFRGNLTNNYVKFGKYTEDAYAIFDWDTRTSSYSSIPCNTEDFECIKIASAGEDMYWRIVRINGDGTIRMVYDGTSAHANNEASENRQIGRSAFNINANDNAYVGYMYGQAGASTYEATHANINDSSLKTTIDRWYSKYLNTSYGRYVANAIYCNDRKIITDESMYQWLLGGENAVVGTGIGTSQTLYGLWGRASVNMETLSIGYNPTLICEQVNDRFTLEGENIETTDRLGGNQTLTYPVGLITADETVLAGGIGIPNKSYYLYTGNGYWTGSASFIRSGYATAYSFDSAGSAAGIGGVDGYDSVRPVISIKTDTLKYGDGTSGNPFSTELDTGQ